ncbi:MAG: isochorismatase family protein [Actinobacteria bacterium]|jgi:nicotinamidase-related amidase|nr:isochorismatase family protein [Actinomycetota bacterium]
MDLSKNMALVVVDPLRRFTVKGAPFEVDGAESIVNGINELANHFRQNSLPVIWVSRLIRPQLSLGTRTSAKYKGMNAAFTGEWAEMDHRLEIKPEDYVIFKPRHSSFHDTDLEIILRENGVKETWLCGFTFNVCVLATAFDAVAKDFKVKFVVDLCGTLPSKFDEKTVDSASIHEYTKIISDYAVGEMIASHDAAKILAQSSSGISN